jgi:hypothetical protein
MSGVPLSNAQKGGDPFGLASEAALQGFASEAALQGFASEAALHGLASEAALQGLRPLPLLLL